MAPWCKRRRLAVAPPRIYKRLAPVADRMRSYRKPRYFFVLLLKVKINLLDVDIEQERHTWIEFENRHTIHSREDVNKYIDDFEKEIGEAVLEYSVSKTIRFADSMGR